MNKKAVLTVEEMQKFLNISRPKAYQLIHQPGFPVLRLGRVVRIPKNQLIQWVEKQVEK